MAPSLTHPDGGVPARPDPRQQCPRGWIWPQTGQGSGEAWRHYYLSQIKLIFLILGCRGRGPHTPGFLAAVSKGRAGGTGTRNPILARSIPIDAESTEQHKAKTKQKKRGKRLKNTGERDGGTELHSPEGQGTFPGLGSLVPSASSHDWCHKARRAPPCPVGCTSAWGHSLREGLESARRRNITTSNSQLVLGWWRRAELGGGDGWRHQPRGQVSLPFPNDDDDGSQEDNQDDEPSGADPQDQAHLLRVLRHLQGTLALFAGSCQGTRTGSPLSSKGGFPTSDGKTQGIVPWDAHRSSNTFYSTKTLQGSAVPHRHRGRVPLSSRGVRGSLCVTSHPSRPTRARPSRDSASSTTASTLPPR